MTIKFIYSLRDKKAECFLQPVFERNTQTIIRSLREVFKDENHQLTKHTSDFDLYELGMFDEVTGEITLSKDAPVFIVRLEHIKESHSELENYDFKV